MNRDELHALVWSQPMRSAAKSMAISDVALAKRCRKANVPVPPRGWWARKTAGKRVEVTPLPPLPFVLSDYFPAMERQPGPTEAPIPPADEFENSAPPVFRDLMKVSEEIQAAVRPVKVPTTLTDPHPIVARLLKQDEGRKADQSIGGYFSSFYGPKFTSPIQRRRLRIMSCLFTEFNRLGCKIDGSTHAGERFSIKIGYHWTYILFGVEGSTSSTPFYRGRRDGEVESEQLRFDLVEHDDRTPPLHTWRETEGPLEQQATEIICGILLKVEEKARNWVLWRHKEQVQQRARAVKEAKLAAEKAEIERIARAEAAAAARIQALIDGADALERAARIRRYVAAVRVQNDARAEPVPVELFEAWAKWALAEADQIDPVISGQFISNLIVSDKAD